MIKRHSLSPQSVSYPATAGPQFLARERVAVGKGSCFVPMGQIRIFNTRYTLISMPAFNNGLILIPPLESGVLPP